MLSHPSFVLCQEFSRLTSLSYVVEEEAMKVQGEFLCKAERALCANSGIQATVRNQLSRVKLGLTSYYLNYIQQ